MAAKSSTALADFPVPVDVDLERDVVVLAAANVDCIDEMAATVGAGAFASQMWAKAWDTLLDMHRQGTHVDSVTFTSRLDGSISKEVMIGMVTSTGSRKEALAHAEVLKTLSAKRRLYTSAVEMLRVASSPDTTVPDVMAAVTSASDKVTSPIRENSGVTVEEAVDELAMNIQEIGEGNGVKVTTGFRLLDIELKGGMAPGQLIVLAARPSVGKTAVMLQMAYMAARGAVPVMIYSLEMTSVDLAERYMLSTEQVGAYDMANGAVDWDAFDRAQNDYFRGIPLVIDESSRTLEEIVSSITVKSSKGECRVAFIDYLGYIRTDERKGELYAQRIERITNTLKATALKCRIPIVLLSQINRDSVREGRPPELHDIRNSGSVEQDADVVLMLDRKENAELDTDNRLAGSSTLDMYIRKNRKGQPNRKITLQPNGTYTHFDELGINS